ncbi:MAG: hypothetical protein LUE27_02190 [Clostridia bacterium]|nr:hypothetical protein [Clostridia bacterium]
MDEAKIQHAVKYFCGNSCWCHVYATAPSTLSKRYWALSFYLSWYSLFIETEIEKEAECLAEFYDVQDRMSGKDWEHINKYCANNPLKAISSRRKKLAETGELSLWDWEWLTHYVGIKDPFREVCLQKVKELSGQQEGSSSQEDSNAVQPEDGQ